MPSVSPGDVVVDDATEADVPAIVAIYNEVMTNSTAIWSDRPVSVEERVAWLHDRRSAGRPVLVARLGDETIGFTSYGPFRDWPGYVTTAELSIHIADGHRGRGAGHLLLGALIDRARSAGLHALVAGVDADNDGSIRFHREHGFHEVARMPEVGRKFGQWLDLVLLQLTLGAEG
jgi:phosphinothricin acetyltransferase